MSELFPSYEQEFVRNLAMTQKKLESLTIQTNLKQELAFNDIKIELSEVEKNLKFMETEAGSMPSHVRPKFQEKAAKYKREYNEIKRKILRQQEVYAQEKNKQMLMEARIDEEQNTKEKFLKNGQLLSDATYKLKDSVKVIRNIEGISNDVQIQLVSHTGRLKENKEKLLGIHEDLTESQQILAKMAALMRRHKLVLAVVLGAILLAGIITLSIVIIKNKKAASNSTSIA